MGERDVERGGSINGKRGRERMRKGLMERGRCGEPESRAP